VHGWPYTSEGAAYPGWSFYAATVFNYNNPWWIVMPDLTKYVQRMSYMLRQGTPAMMCWFICPTATRGRHDRRASAAQRRPRRRITATALAAGYNVDFCDDQLLEMRGKVQGNTIAFGNSKYRVVVLSGPTPLPRPP